ncbi:ADP-ribosylation [Corynespora cassiicola Philippines]|uniref:ADP-ribosylation n=1 Tax=Corynespora cassiicola Philippines TaxID=1448308 RepID=A0A2T2N3J2_CORCC|nr:ADP-ribosylation [Corynespora cassiicola Philippines]
MATHRTFLITLLLATLWSLLCSAQVYRADSRSPDNIRGAGGFQPRGGAIGAVPADISLWNHVNGAANGFSRMDDGYVSTTTDRNLADSWVRNNFGGNGWIYRIALAPNMIDCQATLGTFNPFPNEREMAAIGGIRYEQIIGWSQMVGGTRQAEVANPGYNGARYNGLRGAGAQPSLAAFPANHRAWSQAPWNAFSTCTNPRRAARDFEKRQSCGPRQSNVQFANEYMARNNL